MTPQKFEFTNYNVPVDIAGHTFTLDCSSETGDYLKSVSENFRSLAREIGSGEKSVEDAAEYGMQVLDRLLGKGAADTIFTGRKKRVSDITDVCLFLTDVAARFQEERTKLNGNRAQRRGTKTK